MTSISSSDFIRTANMKMISNRAIRKSIRNRDDVPLIQSQEIRVISFLNKNILAIRAAIVDVVISIVEQRGWTGHE